jgi:hypothetical protein
MAVFDFAPERYVPGTLPRENGSASVITMGGWQFTSKPTTPYQRRFKLTLYGMRWYLTNGGLFDDVTDPTFNAFLLEKFYQEHEMWKPFDFNHQHIGPLVCRFALPLTVPAAEANSSGLIKSVEVNFIEHNPGYN